MPTGLRILGVVHVLFGLLGLLITGFLLIIMFGSPRQGDEDRIVFLFWGAVLTFFYFLPSVSAGFGLAIGRQTSRPALWLESVLLLLFLPIGTVLGLVTMWMLYATRDPTWDRPFFEKLYNFDWRSRLNALVLISIAMGILAAIIGMGYLFRDVIDPPVQQELTPMPSMPPQLPPDIQQPTFP
jgi:hypothetical protein